MSKYMQQAINEAKKATNKVSPNPSVGCVIVKNGKIIGKGYHEKYGGNHAEINAIESAKEDISGSTAYVTLEPCFHYGKTPPCVDALIEHKVAKVVIGTKDPNPKVSGKSIIKLQKNGIEVTAGILEKECRYLSRFFITNQEKKRAHIILKVAQSQDGYISSQTNTQTKITSKDSDIESHILRSKVDAILVGANTVRVDNPSLTVRHIPEDSPKRVVLSLSGNIPIDSNVFQDFYKKNTLLCVPEGKQEKIQSLLPEIKVIGVKMLENSFCMKHFLSVMESQNIFSILVEGGNQIWNWFLEEGIVDEIWEFTSENEFEGGVRNMLKVSDCFSLYNEGKFGGDVLKVFLSL